VSDAPPAPPDAARRTPAVWALMALLAFQAVSAIVPGAMLVASPDGELIKLPLSHLEGSPFHDFLIPGLILLFVLGIGPLGVLIGVWRRSKWGWYGSFAVGCALIIWIVVEVVIVPFSALQVTYGTVGVLIAAVTLAPSVRRYCGVRIGGR
jgi:hypothetical protein